MTLTCEYCGSNYPNDHAASCPEAAVKRVEDLTREAIKRCCSQVIGKHIGKEMSREAMFGLIPELVEGFRSLMPVATNIEVVPGDKQGSLRVSFTYGPPGQ